MTAADFCVKSTTAIENKLGRRVMFGTCRSSLIDEGQVSVQQPTLGYLMPNCRGCLSNSNLVSVATVRQLRCPAGCVTPCHNVPRQTMGRTMGGRPRLPGSPCGTRPDGGSGVLRTSSIHADCEGVFRKFPHLCPQEEKCVPHCWAFDLMPHPDPAISERLAAGSWQTDPAAPLAHAQRSTANGAAV